MKRVLIIGGMAAGCKTAARVKRINPDYDVTIIEQRSFISFGACGMPLFAAGDVDDFFDLAKTPFGVVRDEEYFSKVKDVNVLLNTKVTKIDPDKKTITIKNNNNSEESFLEYDELVIATGAKPLKPPFKCPDSENISTFHHPLDAKRFREKAQKGLIESAVIIGGGLIGCELAEALVSLWGIETTLVERENRLLPGCLDEELSPVLEKYFRNNDVNIKLSTTVEKVELGEDGNPIVFTNGGEEFHADYLFLCLGVKPVVSLASEAGIRLGQSGGIATDGQLRTNIPNIWAGGDCIEIKNLITSELSIMPLGSLANRQGRVIANSIAGKEDSFKGAVGAMSMKVFDLITCSTGLSEHTALKLGYDAASVTGCWYDRPDYHPDHKSLFAKLVFDKSSHKILGAQMIGEGEVTRYIDTLTEMLKNNADIRQLIDAEHCYMPAHSSPMNPLNGLGSMAESLIFDDIDCMKCSKSDDFTGLVLDVREDSEVEANPYPFPSIRIPLKGFRKKVVELRKEASVLIVCQKGPRAYDVAKYMKNIGFSDVSYLGGGCDLKLLL